MYQSSVFRGEDTRFTVVTGALYVDTWTDSMFDSVIVWSISVNVCTIL